MSHFVAHMAQLRAKISQLGTKMTPNAQVDKLEAQWANLWLKCANLGAKGVNTVL